MTIFPCPDSMFPLDRRQQEEEKGGNECRTHPEFSMQFSFFSFPEIARDSVARSVVNPSAFPICRCCWSTTFASETRQGMGLLLLCVAGNEIIDLLLRVPVRASNFLPLLVPSSPEIKCVFVLGPSILLVLVVELCYSPITSTLFASFALFYGPCNNISFDLMAERETTRCHLCTPRPPPPLWPLCKLQIQG